MPEHDLEQGKLYGVETYEKKRFYRSDDVMPTYIEQPTGGIDADGSDELRTEYLANVLTGASPAQPVAGSYIDRARLAENSYGVKHNYTGLGKTTTSEIIAIRVDPGEVGRLVWLRPAVGVIVEGSIFAVNINSGIANNITGGVAPDFEANEATMVDPARTLVNVTTTDEPVEFPMIGASVKNIQDQTGTNIYYNVEIRTMAASRNLFETPVWCINDGSSPMYMVIKAYFNDMMVDPPTGSAADFTASISMFYTIEPIS